MPESTSPTSPIQDFGDLEITEAKKQAVPEIPGDVETTDSIIQKSKVKI